MSRFLTNAELIKQRLDSHFASLGAGWAEIGVVVYRQKDIESEVDLILAKASGACITVLWDGFDTTDPKQNLIDLSCRYSLAVWCAPTADENNPGSFADNVVEQTLLAIHGWVSDAGHSFLAHRISNGNLVPHSSYLIYELNATVRTLIE